MLATALIWLVACSDDTIVESHQENACIEFKQQVDSRAIVAGANDVKDLSVWCGFSPQASPDKVFNLFNGDKVYRQDGTLIYDEIRFWLDGIFQYAAVHPYSLAGAQNGASVVSFNPSSTNELLKISNYQLTRDEDLMIAIPAQIEYIENETSTMVNLMFNHALAQVKFYAKSKIDNYNAVIQSWSLYVPLHADLTCRRDGTMSWSNWDQISTTPFYTQTERTIVGSDYTLLASSLTFPLTANSVQLRLEITIESNTGGYTTKSADIPIPTEGWSPGIVYRYNIEVDSNYNIVFNDPTTYPWVNVAGDIIVIDPTTSAIN